MTNFAPCYYCTLYHASALGTIVVSCACTPGHAVFQRVLSLQCKIDLAVSHYVGCTSRAQCVLTDLVYQYYPSIPSISYCLRMCSIACACHNVIPCLKKATALLRRTRCKCNSIFARAQHAHLSADSGEHWILAQVRLSCSDDNAMG